MPNRRSILLGAIGAFAAASAHAADPAAVAFVTGIFAAYKGKNAKGIALDTDAALRRYFEPSLAALISKDRKDAARRHDVPTLDGDPFVDAQDWDIRDFAIAVTDTNAGNATATVKFVNAGEPSTVTLDLVAANNDWRISDITWLRDGKPVTLRSQFAH